MTLWAAVRRRRRIPAMIAYPGAEYKWPRGQFTEINFVKNAASAGALTHIVKWPLKQDKSPENQKIFRGFGMPDRIRTCDLWSRSPTRYPAAPLARIAYSIEALHSIADICPIVKSKLEIFLRKLPLPAPVRGTPCVFPGTPPASPRTPPRACRHFAGHGRSVGTRYSHRAPGRPPAQQ